jgi:nitrilase
LTLLDEIPGEPDRLLQSGGSAIIGPNGDYLAGPVFDEPVILTAEIEPNAAIESRLTLDTDGHYARPDIFEMTVNEKTAEGVKFDGG